MIVFDGGASVALADAQGRVNLEGARLMAGAPPRPEFWAAELTSGWPGSNGSSCSTDTMCGVRIGRTSPEHSTLPADVHDFWYRVLRRLHATTRVSEAEVLQLRARVDLAFRDNLLALAGDAPFGTRTVFRIRCLVRYRAVRRLGGLVNRPDLAQERFL